MLLAPLYELSRSSTHGLVAGVSHVRGPSVVLCLAPRCAITRDALASWLSVDPQR